MANQLTAITPLQYAIYNHSLEILAINEGGEMLMLVDAPTVGILKRSIDPDDIDDKFVINYVAFSTPTMWQPYDNDCYPDAIDWIELPIEQEAVVTELVTINTKAA